MFLSADSVLLKSDKKRNLNKFGVQKFKEPNADEVYDIIAKRSVKRVTVSDG